MEDKLKILFDFQRFHNNLRLAQVVAETESKFCDNGSKLLNDDELSFVSAAGDFNPKSQKKGGDDSDT